MPFTHLKKKVKDALSEVKTSVHENQTIEEAIAVLRNKHIEDNILYFYVLDDDEKLVGVISARDLLLKESSSRISDIMRTNLVFVNEGANLQEAMAIMETQNLLALPVINFEGKFIGVVDVNQYLEGSIDVANSKNRLQVFQMLGFFLDEGKRTSTWKSYRTRMPWILCNMVGGLMCAVISAIFEDVLQHVILLAMFIPLVLSLSESISMQAMTQSMTQPPSQHFLKEHPLIGVFRQWKIFSLLALSSGLVVGAASILWGDGIGPAAVIAISIMISITVTAFIGSAVPIFLHMRRLDPKVASGPLVLMSADVITTLVYLSLATWLLLPS